MKKTIYLIALLAGSFLFNTTNAQVRVNFNIGIQPVWGPVGYDYVDYYYLPDIEAYYYVPQHLFFYQEHGAWISTVSLPVRYGSFDLYHAYKVVINEPKPYLHHETYRTKYASYKGQHNQNIIRDSHESKYFEIKEHPEHSKWKPAPQGNGGNHENRGQEQHAPQGHDEHHEGGDPHKK